MLIQEVVTEVQTEQPTGELWRLKRSTDFLILPFCFVVTLFANCIRTRSPNFITSPKDCIGINVDSNTILEKIIRTKFCSVQEKISLQLQVF
jgi:hypothetical protein